MSIGGHQSARSRTEEWLTPPEIIEQLGPFDLDPCAPVSRPWDTARLHYTRNDNGLTCPWFGLVWLNPPYGHKTGQWLERLSEHGRGIALVFARTETDMFHRFVWRQARALLFIAGRLHFHHVDGRRASANAGAPSVLIAYGSECAERLEASSIPGAFVNEGWCCR